MGVGNYVVILIALIVLVFLFNVIVEWNEKRIRLAKFQQLWDKSSEQERELLRAVLDEIRNDD